MDVDGLIVGLYNNPSEETKSLFVAALKAAEERMLWENGTSMESFAAEEAEAEYAALRQEEKT